MTKQATMTGDEIRKAAKSSGKEKLERQFAEQVLDAGLPEPETQYKWHPTRRFRADFAWPEHKVIAEIQGGIFARGRHTRGLGYSNDRARSNEAQVQGWTVIEITEPMIRDGSGIGFVRQAIEGRTG